MTESFDVEGARALGVESVGVTYGYGSKEELKEAKADYIVQSVDELEKFLLRGSEELRNSNPDAKKKNPMYQRIWTMVYSFLMFILVRNVIRVCPAGTSVSAGTVRSLWWTGGIL